MPARRPARRLALRARTALVALVGAGAAAAGVQACYSAGAGSGPPPNAFYFPVGLAVSQGAPSKDGKFQLSQAGKFLYAANSDFDLQWNGGTLQSYDLGRIRADAAQLIDINLGKGGGFADGGPAFSSGGPGCAQSGPGIPLEETCAPPVNAEGSGYVKDHAIIGAFATDLQVGLKGSRLFVPVRGDDTLTWADLDDATGKIDCHQGSDGRCSADHQAGSVLDPGNTRPATLPGEPFGMAQTEDQTALAITHQADTKTSLLLAGSQQPYAPPSMQFVLDGVPLGGDGIAAVPHDPWAGFRLCEAVKDQPPCVRPAFLQTSRSVAEVDLLRYYDDDGSSLTRPFLAKEVAYGVTTNGGGFDSRGIAIDKSPRAACRARLPAGMSTSHDDPAWIACGQVPARVFIANRSPPSLVVGEVGGPSRTGDGTYDPDRLTLTGNVPLSDGPSKVYVAPVVLKASGGGAGVLAVRVFIVCFDSSVIFVYDPDAQAVENVIFVGPGPFAMAFDPFDPDAMATNAVPTADATGMTYRFAYVASFRDSFVQLLDLDQNSPATYEHVVYTLGTPTPPKGT
jgi:hypothetical protein